MQLKIKENNKTDNEKEDIKAKSKMNTNIMIDGCIKSAYSN